MESEWEANLLGSARFRDACHIVCDHGQGTSGEILTAHMSVLVACYFAK